MGNSSRVSKTKGISHDRKVRAELHQIFGEALQVKALQFLTKVRDDKLEKKQRLRDDTIRKAASDYEGFEGEVNTGLAIDMEEVMSNPFKYWERLQTSWDGINAPDGDSTHASSETPWYEELARSVLDSTDTQSGTDRAVPVADMGFDRPTNTTKTSALNGSSQVGSSHVSGQNARIEEAMTQTQICLISGLLETLKTRPVSQPFCEPVDGCLVRDYYETVHNPMDLQTLIDNLANYKSVQDFMNHFDLILEAARQYNEEDGEIVQAAVEMSTLFKRDMHVLMSSNAKDCHSRTRAKKRRVTFGDIRKDGPDPIDFFGDDDDSDYVPT